MKTIKLYMLSDETIVNETGIQAVYDDLSSETFGEDFPCNSFDEWLTDGIKTGSITEITATLSDGLHVYPYYFFTDEQDTMTIMELYAIYQQTDDWKYWKTFADLLNNPQVDRNGVDFYGFYL